MKLTNIRIREGHACIVADVQTTTGKGWVEHWFEEDCDHIEIEEGDLLDSDLEPALEALSKHYEAQVKPKYLALVEALNAELKDETIELAAEVKEATFVSVWDGETKIESTCKVNMETKEVFDIELVDVSDLDVDACTNEFVEIDEEIFDVYSVEAVSIDEDLEGEFWHN